MCKRNVIAYRCIASHCFVSHRIALYRIVLLALFIQCARCIENGIVSLHDSRFAGNIFCFSLYIKKTKTLRLHLLTLFYSDLNKKTCVNCQKKKHSFESKIDGNKIKYFFFFPFWAFINKVQAKPVAINVINYTHTYAYVHISTEEKKSNRITRRMKQTSSQ